MTPCPRQNTVFCVFFAFSRIYVFLKELAAVYREFSSKYHPPLVFRVF